MSTRYSRRKARAYARGAYDSYSHANRRLPPRFEDRSLRDALRSPFTRLARVGLSPVVQRAFVASAPLLRKPPSSFYRSVVPPSLSLTPQPRQSFCARRAARRSVLFALGVGGKRGSAPGRGGTYRRTAESKLSCGG